MVNLVGVSHDEERFRSAAVAAGHQFLAANQLCTLS
jgi:hypothetical protein